MVDATKEPARLTRKGQATRKRILGAAADLILKQGVAATHITDVREAAGVSGSQMSHYFHDKQALIKDVIAWQAESALDAHRHPELGKLDSFDAWRLWAKLITEKQAARGCAGGCEFGSLAGQLVESDPETRADIAVGYEQWLDLFRQGLHIMRDRGDLRRDADPDALAHALLGTMQGGMLLAQTLRRIDPLRDALNAAVSYLETFATERSLDD
ncbi:TetR/AcrR family transcriptional regulator [Planotetraspora mira]|jgi:AcrR family transcriptional regulator|uniref:Transcriptional regulator n=1 Tax=Planotetraspora mira TaxID=58121 RepID=A0A8J3TR27_9ACTN|nr:TetR/AcrR family transcriptional regulator [Planotetraspora mira]GII30541.1 transcriptional regulator [Planotetraspora mira]